jgi:hypothetical protein
MKPLLTTLVLSFLILPLFTFAQYKPPIADGVITGTDNGLVPCEGSFCSTCDVVVLANTGIKWLLTLSFLFFAILALRAGWKLIISQGNPGALSDAKQSFTNAFIGLIIILTAWIFVDTLMRQLLKGGTGDVNGYGPWSKVQCIDQVKPLPPNEIGTYFGGDLPYIPGQPMKSYTPNSYTGGPLPLCTNAYCSVTALQNAGFTAQQARIMSCIALTESSGNPKNPPYNTLHPGSNSSACGLFSIVKSTWDGVSTGSCSSFSQCTNTQCNTQNALKLVKQSGYSSWTCSRCNNKAEGCISQYSN